MIRNTNLSDGTHDHDHDIHTHMNKDKIATTKINYSSRIEYVIRFDM